MRVKGVVVLEPQGQLGDDGFCVRDGVHRDVVAFERFDEGFGHAVRCGLQRVSGRRGKRAYMDVGSDGHMTAYSGVV